MNRLTAALVFGLLVASSTHAMSQSAPGSECRTGETPSFNCNDAATIVEKAICHSKDLSTADCLLGYVYRDAKEKAVASGINSTVVSNEQLAWLKLRDQKCGGNQSCLLDYTRRRALSMILTYDLEATGAFRSENAYSSSDFAPTNGSSIQTQQAQGDATGAKEQSNVTAGSASIPGNPSPPTPAAAEHEKARQAAIEQGIAYQEAHGYKSMAFDDFVLDGQKLADSQAKVAVKGIYKKVGQMPELFPNAMSVLQQRWDEGLPLLIEDDANRGTRQFLLNCDRDIAERGCQITLLGYATICTVTNLAGSHDVPCIKVEDGWNVGE